MSWFFGKLNKHSTNHINPEIDINNFNNSIEKININNLEIIYGGNKNNLIIKKSDNFILIFCGIILDLENNKINNPNIIDIDSLLNFKLNGHYTALIYKDNKLNLFTDKLGLRELFIYENNNFIYFSTNLKYLLKLNKFQINFRELSSKWMLINQLSNRSIIKNIEKINLGRSVVINKNKINIIDFNWLPKKDKDFSIEDFNHNLINLINIEENTTKSICLSGGIDSRLIISYINKLKKYEIFTFETESKADIDTVINLSKKLDFKFKLLQYNKIDFEQLNSEVVAYVGNTYLTECGSLARNLMFYNQLPKENITIDGGFGAIWRREFLIIFQYYGLKYLKNNDINSIIKFFAKPRPNLFIDEINVEMEKGLIQQFEEIINFLPDVNVIGINNWIDLFALKTRLPNYYGPEQSRLDNLLVSFMPFVTNNLIDNLFNMDYKTKSNNKLFKHLIKQNNKDLFKVPLATGKIKYPFFLNSISKKLYFKFYSKLFDKINYFETDIYLDMYKEFTLDTLNSNNFKNYTPYNVKLIKQNVNDYYIGKLENRNFVDWFISFEIFRQLLNDEN